MSARRVQFLIGISIFLTLNLNTIRADLIDPADPFVDSGDLALSEAYFQCYLQCSATPGCVGISLFRPIFSDPFLDPTFANQYFCRTDFGTTLLEQSGFPAIVYKISIEKNFPTIIEKRRFGGSGTILPFSTDFVSRFSNFGSKLSRFESSVQGSGSQTFGSRRPTFGTNFPLSNRPNSGAVTGLPNIGTKFPGSNRPNPGEGLTNIGTKFPGSNRPNSGAGTGLPNTGTKFPGSNHPNSEHGTGLPNVGTKFPGSNHPNAGAGLPNIGTKFPGSNRPNSGAGTGLPDVGTKSEKSGAKRPSLESFPSSETRFPNAGSKHPTVNTVSTPKLPEAKDPVSNKGHTSKQGGSRHGHDEGSTEEDNQQFRRQAAFSALGMLNELRNGQNDNSNPEESDARSEFPHRVSSEISAKGAHGEASTSGSAFVSGDSPSSFVGVNNFISTPEHHETASVSNGGISPDFNQLEEQVLTSADTNPDVDDDDDRNAKDINTNASNQTTPASASTSLIKDGEHTANITEANNGTIASRIAAPSHDDNRSTVVNINDFLEPANETESSNSSSSTFHKGSANQTISNATDASNVASQFVETENSTNQLSNSTNHNRIENAAETSSTSATDLPAFGVTAESSKMSAAESPTVAAESSSNPTLKPIPESVTLNSTLIPESSPANSITVPSVTDTTNATIQTNSITFESSTVTAIPAENEVNSTIVPISSSTNNVTTGVSESAIILTNASERIPDSSPLQRETDVLQSHTTTALPESSTTNATLAESSSTASENTVSDSSATNIPTTTPITMNSNEIAPELKPDNSTMPAIESNGVIVATTASTPDSTNEVIPAPESNTTNSTTVETESWIVNSTTGTTVGSVTQAPESSGSSTTASESNITDKTTTVVPESSTETSTVIAVASNPVSSPETASESNQVSSTSGPESNNTNLKTVNESSKVNSAGAASESSGVNSGVAISESSTSSSSVSAMASNAEQSTLAASEPSTSSLTLSESNTAGSSVGGPESNSTNMVAASKSTAPNLTVPASESSTNNPTVAASESKIESAASAASESTPATVTASESNTTNLSIPELGLNAGISAAASELNAPNSSVMASEFHKTKLNLGTSESNIPSVISVAPAAASAPVNSTVAVFESTPNSSTETSSESNTPLSTAPASESTNNLSTVTVSGSTGGNSGDAANESSSTNPAITESESSGSISTAPTSESKTSSVAVSESNGSNSGSAVNESNAENSTAIASESNAGNSIGLAPASASTAANSTIVVSSPVNLTSNGSELNTAGLAMVPESNTSDAQTTTTNETITIQSGNKPIPISTTQAVTETIPINSTATAPDSKSNITGSNPVQTSTVNSTSLAGIESTILTASNSTSALNSSTDSATMVNTLISGTSDIASESSTNSKAFDVNENNTKTLAEGSEITNINNAAANVNSNVGIAISKTPDSIKVNTTSTEVTGSSDASGAALITSDATVPSAELTPTSGVTVTNHTTITITTTSGAGGLNTATENAVGSSESPTVPSTIVIPDQISETSAKPAEISGSSNISGAAKITSDATFPSAISTPTSGVTFTNHTKITITTTSGAGGFNTTETPIGSSESPIVPSTIVTPVPIQISGTNKTTAEASGSSNTSGTTLLTSEFTAPSAVPSSGVTNTNHTTITITTISGAGGINTAAENTFDSSESPAVPSTIVNSVPVQVPDINITPAEASGSSNTSAATLITSANTVPSAVPSSVVTIKNHTTITITKTSAASGLNTTTENAIGGSSESPAVPSTIVTPVPVQISDTDKTTAEASGSSNTAGTTLITSDGGSNPSSGITITNPTTVTITTTSGAGGLNTATENAIGSSESIGASSSNSKNVSSIEQQFTDFEDTEEDRKPDIFITITIERDSDFDESIESENENQSENQGVEYSNQFVSSGSEASKNSITDAIISAAEKPRPVHIQKPTKNAQNLLITSDLFAEENLESLNKKHDTNPLKPVIVSDLFLQETEGISKKMDTNVLKSPIVSDLFDGEVSEHKFDNTPNQPIVSDLFETEISKQSSFTSNTNSPNQPAESNIFGTETETQISTTAHNDIPKYSTLPELVSSMNLKPIVTEPTTMPINLWNLVSAGNLNPSGSGTTNSYPYADAEVSNQSYIDSNTEILESEVEKPWSCADDDVERYRRNVVATTFSHLNGESTMLAFIEKSECVGAFNKRGQHKVQNLRDLLPALPLNTQVEAAGFIDEQLHFFDSSLEQNVYSFSYDPDRKGYNTDNLALAPVIRQRSDFLRQYCGFDLEPNVRVKAFGQLSSQRNSCIIFDETRVPLISPTANQDEIDLAKAINFLLETEFVPYAEAVFSWLDEGPFINIVYVFGSNGELYALRRDASTGHRWKAGAYISIEYSDFPN